MAEIQDTLSQAINAEPDAPIMVGAGGFVLTRGEACQDATRMARALLTHGLRKGDAIMIRLEDPAKILIARLGCMLGGFPYLIVPSFILSSYASPMYETIEAKYEINADVYDALLHRFTADAQIEDYPDAASAFGFSRSSGFSARRQFKVLVRDRGRFMAYAARHAAHCGLQADDKIIYFSGFFSHAACVHVVHALTGHGVLVAYQVGHSLDGRDDLEHGDLDQLQAIFADVQPTHCVAIWHVRDKLMNNWPSNALKQFMGGLDLSSLRTFRITGSLPDGTAEAFQERLGATKLIRSYGNSELAMGFHCHPSDPEAKRLHTYGKRDQWGDMLTLAENGEMLVKRDYVYTPKNYAQRLSEDASYLHTGDRWSVDGDGYLCFEGRL